MTDKKKDESILFVFTLLIIINFIMFLVYCKEYYNLINDNYNYDGWRFLYQYFAMSIAFIFLIIYFLILKKWRLVLFSFIICLLQYSSISFGIDFISQVGMLFSFLIILFLILFKKYLLNSK